MVKPTKGPNRGAPKVVKVPMRNPLDERGFPKRFREDPKQYLFEQKNKSPGAMGGIKADDLTRLRKELERRGYNPSKMSMDPSGPAGRIIRRVAGEIVIMFDPPRTVKRKDGGLMEAIKRVDAEKEKRLKDGGMIGNLTSNFKGNY